MPVPLNIIVLALIPFHACGAQSVTPCAYVIWPASFEFSGAGSASLQARAALTNPTWPSGGYKDATCQIFVQLAQNCGCALETKNRQTCRHIAFLLARLYIVWRASIVLLSGVCRHRRRLSGSVTLHGGPAGDDVMPPPVYLTPVYIRYEFVFINVC